MSRAADLSSRSQSNAAPRRASTSSLRAWQPPALASVDPVLREGGSAFGTSQASAIPPSLLLRIRPSFSKRQGPSQNHAPGINRQAEPPRPQVCKFHQGLLRSSGSFSGPKVGAHLTAAGLATLRHLSPGTIAYTATPFADLACLGRAPDSRASQASAAASPPLSPRARLPVTKASVAPP
ncbi:hypothetical protein NDU88_002171 [Pleurodeles waltl]|uniref:Uncharacterized protein n=1 Tax=Pleurodeles waltl TaxID=8319 RepID=A0AAV7PDA8_PLEWA|nr:hypothetical protein NDU88_002171 [Pleurodeles waltl]